MKYLLYDIKYYEQFFKQFAGFMYFVFLAKLHGFTLVLPKFRTLAKNENNFTIRGGDQVYYSWDVFYDLERIKREYNVITLDEFVDSKMDIDIDIVLYLDESVIKDQNVKISDLSLPYIEKKKTNYKIEREAFGKYNVIAICGTTYQLPFGSNNYFNIRKQIRYKDEFYREIDNFLAQQQISDYIAVHWRQTDFLGARRGRNILRTPKQIVRHCKAIMQEKNIQHVYIATDSRHKEYLSYFEQNLPLIKYSKPNTDRYVFAVLESILCAKATYFYGTETSLYSINICGERLHLGKDYTQKYVPGDDDIES